MPEPSRASSRWLFAAMVAGVVVVAFARVAPDFSEAWRRGSARDLTRQIDLYWPPDTDGDFLEKVGKGALETLAMSILGTVLAIVLVGPFLYGATRTMTVSGPALWRDHAGSVRRIVRRAFHFVSRLILVLFRSIPELVWAMLFLLLVGLGPVPAVLALGVHTAGVFGKIFAELLEEVRPEPQEALVACGASGPQVFVYGTIGQVVPTLVAYVLYRWEVNIRMATLFGFVGAGGLGQMIQNSMSWMHHDRVGTLMLAVLALVLAVDFASGWLRRRLV